MRIPLILGALVAAAGSQALAETVSSAEVPRPIPRTRPEMKQYLEDMKFRRERIPLPGLTDQERQQLGDRSWGYESRLCYHYLPQSATGQRGSIGGGAFGAFGFSREPDPKISLDYAFKTELFWIVSRTNNCQYCLGHQESKLLAAGLAEDQIAALDGAWELFPPRERAAFAFARKLTYEPHALADCDVDSLREHFSDLQILEMVLSIAGNNAINRWKEGIGVPQSANGGGFGRGRDGQGTGPDAPDSAPHSYLTPTAEAYRDLVSKVAPLSFHPASGEPTTDTVFRRPPQEPREEVERMLAAWKGRVPRLPLVDEQAAREVLGDDAPEGALPQWVLLLANFPRDGKTRILAQRDAEERGDLTPLLKAQVRWIVARQDRAWYALALARRQLHSLGWTDDDVYRLDGDWNEYGDAEQALFNIARKLAAAPVVLTDADVVEGLQHAGPRDVVQLISYVAVQASFNRITQAAGLSIEE